MHLGIRFMSTSKNTKYWFHISPIKFPNGDSLMNIIMVLDNTRLYQSNRQCTDPKQTDVLDSTNRGSGLPVGFSYDLQERTLEIECHAGICATRLVEEGFSAGELVIGMIDEQYDFLTYMQSVCRNYDANPVVTFKAFDGDTCISEKTTPILEYQSKF